MKCIAIAIATVSAQMTLSGQSQGQFAGAYPQAAYPQQTFGQQPMAQGQMGSFSLQQGNTQVNAQVGQFKIPSSQQFSVPAGYQVDPSQYAAQQYTAPTQQYSAPSQYQYQSQGAPQQTRSATLSSVPQMSQYGLPQGYAQAGQYDPSSQYGQASQYPTQQYSGYAPQTGYAPQSSYGYAPQSGYGAQSGYAPQSGYGASSSSGAPGSTQTVQTGVRTMYVPLNQVSQILAQNPGAKMVGTVTADKIPAGAAFF